MKYCCALFLAFCLLMLPMPVYAAEGELTCSESLAALLESSGAPELLEGEGIAELLAQDGISLDAPETITGLSIPQMLHRLAQQAADAAAEPLRLFGILLAVILFSALAESLQSKQASTAEVYEMLCVLCAVGVMVQPISAVFLETSAHLAACADFMMQFSLIFGSVLGVCGGLTTAAAYRGMMLAACELVMQLVSHAMLPMLSMGLALGIVDAVNPAISLGGIVRLLHKSVIWLLGLLMSLFLGLLSLQSMVAASTDRATSKTTRFVLSNAIPFVGSAVSDAYSTVLGSLGVLKTTTGVVGIFAVLALLLPILLRLGIYRLLMAAAGAVAELFGVQRVTKLLQHTESILSAAFSISVSFSVIFIVSIAMMLVLGGGTNP